MSMDDAALTTCGLIGTTIARSLSPAMHNAAFAYHGLPDRYTLWSVSEAELPAQIAALREPGMRGANVTIPHKSPCCRSSTNLGPIRTLWRWVRPIPSCAARTARLLGHQHRCRGLSACAAWGRLRSGRAQVVLLGAGGSARAVAWRLLHLGVRSLTIVNRSPRACRRTAGRPVCDARPGRQTALRSSPTTSCFPNSFRDRSATLLVNATPVGADGRRCRSHAICCMPVSSSAT